MLRAATLAGLALAVLVLPASAGEDKDKDKPKVYKTPQECFDAYAAAEAKGDHKTRIRCKAPQTQKEEAAVIGAIFSSDRARLEGAKEEDAKEQLRRFRPVVDVMDRHGLTLKAAQGVKKHLDAKENDKAKKAVLAVVKDPESFLIDVNEALSKVVDAQEKPAARQKLTELKVEGDKATATVVRTTRGLGGKETQAKVRVSFVKTDGGWRIVPPLEEDLGD